MDDEPDEADGDEQRREQDEEPAGSGEDDAVAADIRRGGLGEFAPEEDEIAVHLGLIAEAEASTEHDGVAGEGVVVVDLHVSEEGDEIAGVVALDADGAEGADDIAGGMTVIYGDGVSEADVILSVGMSVAVARGEEGRGGEQAGEEKDERSESVHDGILGGSMGPVVRLPGAASAAAEC